MLREALLLSLGKSHFTAPYIKINIPMNTINYIDDVPGLEAYKTYDPIVRGILIQDSVWRNPSHTSSFSSLNALHIK